MTELTDWFDISSDIILKESEFFSLIVFEFDLVRVLLLIEFYLNYHFDRNYPIGLIRIELTHLIHRLASIESKKAKT